MIRPGSCSSFSAAATAASTIDLTPSSRSIARCARGERPCRPRWGTPRAPSRQLCSISWRSPPREPVARRGLRGPRAQPGPGRWSAARCCRSALGIGVNTRDVLARRVSSSSASRSVQRPRTRSWERATRRQQRGAPAPVCEARAAKRSLYQDVAGENERDVHELERRARDRIASSASSTSANYFTALGVPGRARPRHPAVGSRRASWCCGHRVLALCTTTAIRPSSAKAILLEGKPHTVVEHLCRRRTARSSVSVLCRTCTCRSSDDAAPCVGDLRAA